MTLIFIRLFFTLIMGFLGFYVGTTMYQPLYGFLSGLGFGLFFIVMEMSLRRVSVRGLSSMVFGLLLGVFMAKLVADVLSLLPLSEFVQSMSRVILTFVFSYLGAVMALRGKDEFNVIIPYIKFRREGIKEGVILLDTSAIIDGKISDIYKTHFLSGRLVVLRSVLHELQKLADSADDIKRQRGRRGMELLRLMQHDSKIDIHIHEDEMEESMDVDARLVRIAKVMDARICTIDFNLGKIAALQGVDILNIHDLVNAAKFVVFTGEQFEIKLVKEGKESNQAVGYMNDGTMVVVRDAQDCIGETVKITVTSVLQTQAGKMIFADLI